MDARHLHSYVEALCHAKCGHRIRDACPLDVDRLVRTHGGGNLESVIVHIGDHHEAGSGVPGDGHGHHAYWSGTGDEHVLSNQVEREGRVRGVAERIEDGCDPVGDLIGDWECVDRGNCQVFGERSGAIDPDPHRITAETPASCPAVTTVATGHMPFAGHSLSYLETAHLRAHGLDHADKFMTDLHADRDRLLRPGVPIDDMEIGATDRGLKDLDPHVVVSDLGDRDVLHPETRFRLALH